MMISGEKNVRDASLLALRASLRLETKGLKRRGASARSIANKIMGTEHRTAVKTYEAFNAYIVNRLGAGFDKPLS
jgi:hypothetical protein